MAGDPGQGPDRAPAAGRVPALVVAGGRGGTTARLDDLDLLGHRLRSAAGRLGEVAAATAALTRDPALLGSILRSPLTAAPAEVALAAAVLGPHGVTACALRLEALGAAAGGAATAYRAADELVHRLLADLELTAGRLIGVGLLVAGPPLLLAGAGAVAGSRIPFLRNGVGVSVSGERLLEFLARHTGTSQFLVATLPGVADVVEPLVAPRRALAREGLQLAGAWSGLRWGVSLNDGFAPSDVRTAAAELGRLGDASPWLREPAAVRTTTTAPLGERPPAGLGDLVHRVSRMSPGEPGPDGAAIPPGTVRVERITGPDGRRAWIVEIPGTHSWQPNTGTDPFDVTSCVHALAGQSTSAGATVVAALREAGVRPDEPVLLAGHSLGGMVAAQLAADRPLRASLRITHVVTAGSPIALSQVPDGVHVLSIEHSDDLVPRLDGARNPDRPGWVTVSRPATDVPLGPVPGSEQGGNDAHPRLEVTHDAAGYARTAAQLDASTDPSLVAWQAELTPFLDRPGATAVSWEVTGARIVPLNGTTQ